MSLNGAFHCSYCGKQFAANFTLRRHIKNFHEDGVLPIIPRGRKPKVYQENSTCLLCNQKLVNKKALIYHRKIKHPAPKQQRSDSYFRRTLQFKSMNDFLRWKSCEEDASVARFVKVSGDYKQRISQATMRVYKCNRSGPYISKARQLRYMKFQGSCKINRVCPAAMFVRIFTTGDVMVSYYAEHRDHDFDISHCRKRSREQALPSTGKLNTFSSHQIAVDSVNSIIKQHLTAAEGAWICIRNAMESDLSAAEVGLEHLVNLKNLLTTLLKRRETSCLPPPAVVPCQQPNKKKSKERCSRMSSSRTTLLYNYKPRLIAPKPSQLQTQTQCVFELLGGDHSCQPSIQLDNADSYGINVEHSYVATIQLL